MRNREDFVILGDAVVVGGKVRLAKMRISEKEYVDYKTTLRTDGVIEIGEGDNNINCIDCKFIGKEENELYKCTKFTNLVVSKDILFKPCTYSEEKRSYLEEKRA